MKMLMMNLKIGHPRTKQVDQVEVTFERLNLILTLTLMTKKTKMKMTKITKRRLLRRKKRNKRRKIGKDERCTAVAEKAL